jgi:hypothetical protein
MSLKNLPIRAPASKVLPRKRSVGERIVATLELAALVRTLSRVLGRSKKRRLPAKGGLLAIAGGGLLAIVLGVLLAKRKSGDDAAPAPQPAPTEAPKAETKPETDAEPDEKATNDAAAEHVPDSDPVPAAVEAKRSLESNGTPTDKEQA